MKTKMWIHFVFISKLHWWMWRCDLCGRHPYRSKIYVGMPWHKGQKLEICPFCVKVFFQDENNWIVAGDDESFWKYKISLEYGHEKAQ